jgi:hypothetical protein
MHRGRRTPSARLPPRPNAVPVSLVTAVNCHWQGGDDVLTDSVTYRLMHTQRGTAYVALGRICVEFFVECLNSGLGRK